MQELLLFTAKRLIAWSIATMSVALVISFIAGDDGTGEEPPRRGRGLLRLLRPGREGEEQEPQEFLKVERLNDRLESYVYSISKAASGKAAALAARRSRDFERRFGAAGGRLVTEEQVAALRVLEDRHRKEMRAVLRERGQALRELRLAAARLEDGGPSGVAGERPGAANRDTEATLEKIEAAAGEALAAAEGIRQEAVEGEDEETDGQGQGAPSKPSKVKSVDNRKDDTGGNGGAAASNAGERSESSQDEGARSTNSYEDGQKGAPEAQDDGNSSGSAGGKLAVKSRSQRSVGMWPKSQPMVRQRELAGKVGKVAAKQATLEASFLNRLAELLTPEQRRHALAPALHMTPQTSGSSPAVQPLLGAEPSGTRQGHAIGWAEGDEHAPLLRTARDPQAVRRVFVLKFEGDLRPSQLPALRAEVTAVVRAAAGAEGDQCVVMLNSPGGSVTGYGLAAAQLERLKAAGVRLTVCVDQVAASGGYLMACVADRVVAPHFAALGSIGVLSEVPNAYERLTREGIRFNTVTAGRYKRTLTPFKKTEQADVDKVTEELEEVLALFKRFAARHRPKLDVDAVATGEVWYGPDALERGLCDQLGTADDVLLEFFSAGAELYSITYRDPRYGTLARLLERQGGREATGLLGLLRRALGRGAGPADSGSQLQGLPSEAVPLKTLADLLDQRDLRGDAGSSWPGDGNDQGPGGRALPQLLHAPSGQWCI